MKTNNPITITDRIDLDGNPLPDAVYDRINFDLLISTRHEPGDRFTAGAQIHFRYARIDDDGNQELAPSDTNVVKISGDTAADMDADQDKAEFVSAIATAVAVYASKLEIL